MKKFAFYAAIFGSTLCVVSCKNDQTASQAAAPQTPVGTYEPLPPTSHADEYTLTSGKMNWTGSKATGSKHTGTISLKEGSFYVKDGRLVGTKAVIDMNSITVEDLTDAGEKRDFVDHMKAKDFFDTAKFPTATFELTDNIKNPNLPDFPLVMIGQFTLHGVTKEINIPAKTEIIGNTIKITSPGFAINRTDYGITFGSGIINTAKDKIIDDHISLNLEVVATKK
jgi:polyisoprenoid-binding protein YceI